MPVVNLTGGGGSASATFTAENIKYGVTITLGGTSVEGTLYPHESVTAAEYAALGTPDSNTMYCITE